MIKLSLVLILCSAHEIHRATSVDSALDWVKDELKLQQRQDLACEYGLTECQRSLSLTVDTTDLSLEQAFKLCLDIHYLQPYGRDESMITLSTNHPEGKAMSMFGPTSCQAIWGYEIQSHVWIAT